MLRTILFLIFLLILPLASHIPVAAQPDPSERVLVNGNPPLTQLMVGKVIVLLDWVLELQMNEPQQLQIKDMIIRTWRTNDPGAIRGTLDIIEVYEGIAKLSEQQRVSKRHDLQTVLLQSLNNNPDHELSRFLLSAYKARHGGGAGKNTQSSSTSQRKGTRVGADGFSGIYRLVRPKALNMNGGSYESGVTVEYITFLPDGHVYWTLPAGGLLYFDPNTAQRQRPNDWGTYEIKGSEVHILRGPERKLYVMPRAGDRLNNPPSLGKGSFRPVPTADGLRLAGAYRRGQGNPSIRFAHNGTFADEGAFAYSSYTRLDGSQYKDDGVGGTGTYLIEQNTLELKYSDGRVKRFSFIAFPENLAKAPAIDSFIINWNEAWSRN